MKIYVGNLSYEVTEEDLKTAFSQFGQVESASIIKDRETGRSKGFGFIEMSNTEGKSAMDSLNGKELKGRNLNVNEARPMERRDNKSAFFSKESFDSKRGFGNNKGGFGGGKGGFGGGGNKGGRTGNRGDR